MDSDNAEATHPKSTPEKRVRLIVAGKNGRVVPGLDFSVNTAVRAAMDEYERRQITVGDRLSDD